MTVKRTLSIIQLGNPPADLKENKGEQSDWIKRALSRVNVAIKVVRPHEGDALPDPTTVSAAVLTGSWSMVTDHEPWSMITASWIREAMESRLPLFGICYGHQLMAQALGGSVGFHPDGREIGQHFVRLEEQASRDPLIRKLPATFLANLTHEQTVLKPPASAFCLAKSDHDPYQILRYSPTAISVQFHPEFDESLMASCLLRRQSVFAEEGYDIPAMVAGLLSTPLAREILVDFVESSM
jgi:GMP synthase (glutamine-hydrolysing)